MTDTLKQIVIAVTLAVEESTPTTCQECGGFMAYTPRWGVRGVFECLRCGAAHDARLYFAECQACEKQCMLEPCEFKREEVQDDVAIF